jgi:ABC-2 type transport system permease protein
MTTQAKAALTRDRILAARDGLIPVSERTWLGGFGNMLRKELGQWWGTKTWWSQILLWLLIINVITTIIMVEAVRVSNDIEAQQIQEQLTGEEPQTPVEQGVQGFLQFGIFAIAIGGIIAVQGAVVGERELGTAEWIMSKPASRSGFILAKGFAYAINLGFVTVLVPTVVFIIAARLILPTPLDLQLFLIGVGVMALSLFFYIALTLMLGAAFKSRGAVAGISIAVLMGGMALKGMVPQELLMVTPWPLGDIASGLALDTPLPDIWWVPIVATALWIPVMLIFGLWRFSREEF